MSRKNMMIALGLVVAVGIAVAISMSVAGDAPQEFEIAVTGDSLARFGGDPASDTAVGQRSPVVTGTDFEGNEVTIGDDGPAILIFLAHWCPHCQAEVPEVVRWIGEGRLPSGVDLVAVATGITPARDNYPPDAWLERENWTAPILVDDENSTAGTAFGLSAYPYWVFLDGEGNVALRAESRIGLDVLDTLVALLAADG